MLELKRIVKNYETGGETVEALKGIDLEFRKNEFVSILGPSGCGKTTLLNIIGGLDQYTSGDLVIDGVSTKKYKDRDWDTYRNHKIGFVFQSYNLIPHQSVLSNVEIALSLSGVSKSERRRRAKEALEKVGLGDQLKKKPNQMSGGQMQRVAIARALVNDPDIILADEPTGALDTETSVQVMDILKEISKERLIIMVTHNPDIAHTYSSRIIRMLDGNIIDDSNPLSRDEVADLKKEDAAVAAETSVKKKEKKSSMSFATSFMLSLKNLFTKKGRTTLTSFAGSIGIIGIALIISVSQGTTAYIDSVQEEALSSYPITLEATTVELTSVMEAFMNMTSSDVDHDKNAVYQKESLANIINAVNSIEQSENDLRSFDDYLNSKLNDSESSLSQAVNGVQYTYDLDMLIYTENESDGKIMRSDAQELMTELMIKYMGDSVTQMMTMTEQSSMGSMSQNMSVNIWQELLPSKDGGLINDLLKDQYDVIYGEWPSSYDEVVLVVDENNEINDLTLFGLGLVSEKEIDDLVNATLNKTQVELKNSTWSYEDICAQTYKVIFNADCYVESEVPGIWRDKRDNETELRALYDSAQELRVVGIIRPSEDCTSPMLKGSVCYTSALTEYVIEKSQNSPAVQAQLNNPQTDILTGLPFASNTSMTDDEKKSEFIEYVSSLDVKGRADVYKTIFAMNLANEAVSILSSDELRALAVEFATSSGYDVDADELEEYMAGWSDEYINSMIYQGVYSMIQQQLDPISLSALASSQGAASGAIDSSSVDPDTLTPGQLASVKIQQFLTQGFSEAALNTEALYQAAANVSAELAAYEADLAARLDLAIDNMSFTDEQFAKYHDEIVQFSESSYEANLASMGHIALDDPATINIYANSFENKDVITDAIDEYNAQFDETQEDMKIKYTDFIGIMMSSVTTIINAITYVLIAFVAISLIVSSIMIGVITLISVQERTKEIGILRAIGASKKNVSRMFNAETMIVGFSAGLLGVLVTYLLCIPINAILYAVTDIANLKAFLPIEAAITLVVISVLLTLISGIIPSRSAAKKDPVVALRTE